MTTFIDTHLHFPGVHAEAFIPSLPGMGVAGFWNITDPKLYGRPENWGGMPGLVETTKRLSGGAGETVWWPDWHLCREEGFPGRIARQIDEFARAGILGLKVWKDMGLGVRDPQGKLLALDDERLNPVWEALLRNGLLLIAHVADPASFWLPFDESNPAYEALKRWPEWHFGKPGLPSREVLFERRRVLHRRFPQLVILNCHFGGYADDAATLSALMDEMPNFHASMGAGHLHPEDPSFASLVERHGDRITFETDLGIPLDRGPDNPWNTDMYARAQAKIERTFEPMGRQALEAFARGNAGRLAAACGRP